MAAGVPSNASASRAAGTSTRRRPRRPGPHPHSAVIGPGLKQDVAVLRASGMTMPGIAHTLKRDLRTVKRVQQLPDVKQRIVELREAWKREAQQRVTGLADDTWTMVGEFVSARDSKQLDNTMRAVAAMEKVSASVSGETQKVEVSGRVEAPPQVELKALVLQLFGGASALDSGRD